MTFESISKWHPHGEHTKLIVGTLPKEIQEILKNYKCCLAGGYIRSFYDGTLGKYPFFIKSGIDKESAYKEKFKKLMDSGTDIDIFAPDKDTSVAIINELKSKYSCWVYNKPKKVHGTTKNSTFIDLNIDGTLVKVQVVYRWGYTDVKSTIKDFDYTCTQAGIYYDSEVYKEFLMVRSDSFVKDCKNRILRYNEPDRDEEVAGSFRRSLKYIRKGWMVGEDTMATLICRALSNRMDESELRVIYRELTDRFEDVSKFPYFK